MADHGIKVGSNLNTNTDAQLNLTSKYSSLKIYKWGNAQFTTDGDGVGSVTIGHDLDYAPMVMVFKKFTAQLTFLSATTYPNSFRPVNTSSSYDSADYFKFSTDDAELVIATVSAAASTTFYFRYMIFVDLSQAFSDASNIALTDDFGFKVSKPDKNVLTGEEYDMALSSKYKALQYYPNHVEASSLTLPAMWASAYDREVQEATYVDFNHNLGYQPFFLVYSDLATAYLYEVPFVSGVQYLVFDYLGHEEVSAWCDSSRVRVFFNRKSHAPSGEIYGTFYSAKTVSIKVIIFAENLAGEASP